MWYLLSSDTGYPFVILLWFWTRQIFIESKRSIYIYNSINNACHCAWVDVYEYTLQLSAACKSGFLNNTITFIVVCFSDTFQKPWHTLLHYRPVYTYFRLSGMWTAWCQTAKNHTPRAERRRKRKCSARNSPTWRFLLAYVHIPVHRAQYCSR